MARYPKDTKTDKPRDHQMEGLKLPPHSTEAEQSVLGGLMLDNERWDNVSERVTGEDFSAARTGRFSVRCSACSSRDGRLT